MVVAEVRFILVYVHLALRTFAVVGRIFNNLVLDVRAFEEPSGIALLGFMLGAFGFRRPRRPAARSSNSDVN